MILRRRYINVVGFPSVPLPFPPEVNDLTSFVVSGGPSSRYYVKEGGIKGKAGIQLCSQRLLCKA